MTLKNIPTDSILHHWCRYLSTSEIPFSYQVACGLTSIGSLLRRNRWIDQLDYNVYPCQSVLLIGPSGIGKDTVINRTIRTMDKMEFVSKVPILGGTTYEGICARLVQMSKPAAAYIPANELTAFFGRAEYQQTMLAGMTNILSCGDKVDVSTKGAMFDKDHKYTGHAQIIYEPTVTMHGGSTVEWLHRQMPDGTLEGGFLGRFLIMCEDLGSRHVPLLKFGKTPKEVETVRNELEYWHSGVEEVVKACLKPAEVHVLDDAAEVYGNWYHNRFKQFSKAVLPYANRSRDMVLRLAMCMAISRGHYRYIEAVDVEFAIALIREVAQKIDKVVLPPSTEGAIAVRILDMLPASETAIYMSLGDRFDWRRVLGAMELLRRSNRIWTNNRNGNIEVTPQEMPSESTNT